MKNDPAFPTEVKTSEAGKGLTKFEVYARSAMEGLLSANYMSELVGKERAREVARASVQMANAIINQIEKGSRE